MSGRAYLAWNMLATAVYEDEQQENERFQKKMRDQVGNPLETLSDQKFIKLYGLNKEAFEDLCQLLRLHTDLSSTQRVSLETKVLCALLFFAHGDEQSVVGKANHFSQEAISVYIQEVTAALNNAAILKKYITFPSSREERDIIKQRFSSKYKIPGVVGCIDGCHFQIFTPNKEEKHIYLCRKHHSLNVQMICDCDCRILSINAKFGGATHDAFVWDNSNINSYMQSLHRNNETVWLLGDTGYPQRPWLMTPYSDAAPGSFQETFNNVHSSARVVIENTFGRLRNRWRCLHRDRTLHYKPAKCAQIIMACSVLHNIAIEYRVPDPENTEGYQPYVTFQPIDVMVKENEATSDLIKGKALRDQIAKTIAHA